MACSVADVQYVTSSQASDFSRLQSRLGISVAQLTTIPRAPREHSRCSSRKSMFRSARNKLHDLWCKEANLKGKWLKSFLLVTTPSFCRMTKSIYFVYCHLDARVLISARRNGVWLIEAEERKYFYFLYRACAPNWIGHLLGLWTWHGELQLHHDYLFAIQCYN